MESKKTSLPTLQLHNCPGTVWRFSSSLVSAFSSYILILFLSIKIEGQHLECQSFFVAMAGSGIRSSSSKFFKDLYTDQAGPNPDPPEQMNPYL